MFETFCSPKTLAKSKGLTLMGHLLPSAKIARMILNRWAKDYDKKKRMILLTGAFLHDVGKLDPVFQAMLRGEEVKKRVKHEANTIDYEKDIRNEFREITGYLQKQLEEPVEVEEEFIDDILAFAATHHGLFYLSKEKEQWRIRREWTVFNLNETERITLVDLLFEYHPMGGLVMISDLIQSYCYEKEIEWKNIIENARSYREVIHFLIENQKILEQSLSSYDPRDYNFQEILTLLGGALI